MSAEKATRAGLACALVTLAAAVAAQTGEGNAAAVAVISTVVFELASIAFFLIASPKKGGDPS